MSDRDDFIKKLVADSYTGLKEEDLQEMSDDELFEAYLDDQLNLGGCADEILDAVRAIYGAIL